MSPCLVWRRQFFYRNIRVIIFPSSRTGVEQIPVLHTFSWPWWCYWNSVRSLFIKIQFSARSSCLVRVGGNCAVQACLSFVLPLWSLFFPILLDWHVPVFPCFSTSLVNGIFEVCRYLCLSFIYLYAHKNCLSVIFFFVSTLWAINFTIRASLYYVRRIQCMQLAEKRENPGNLWLTSKCGFFDYHERIPYWINPVFLLVPDLAVSGFLSFSTLCTCLETVCGVTLL